MIIDYSPQEGITLVDPEDFKRFKFRMRQTNVQRPALEHISFIDDNHVYIDVESVPAFPGAPHTETWLQEYRAMVRYASGRGWLDSEQKMIRAHVERI